MSATPANPQAAAAADPTDADRELESMVGLEVWNDRSNMSYMYNNVLAQNYVPNPGKTPIVALQDGFLAVIGTNFADTIKVQQYPALYAQDGHLVKAAEYYVDIKWVEGRTPHHLSWDVPLSSVPNHTIYAYGLKDRDNIEFVVSGTSQTQLFMSGGDGIDTISGGPNADFLDGGDVDNSADTIHGFGGGDLVAGGPGDDKLFGEDGDDALVGEAGVDTMRGGTGNDDMFGGADNDTMYGDSENDLLFGGDGVDALNGEAGQDYLSGGQDGKKDNLWGGDDKDRFRVEGTEANNKDKPHDYHPEKGDQYVRSYTDPGKVQARASASAVTDPNLAWLALDASFADLGLRPTLRMFGRTA